MSLPRCLFVVGTRPEAIKLAPVITDARAYDDWSVEVCLAGQHPNFVRPALACFGIDADHECKALAPGLDLDTSLTALVENIAKVVDRRRPDVVVGQGDTTTVVAAALASERTPGGFCHVEAGLRTGDLSSPFPEEANRRTVASMARLHLAPSIRAVAALEAEGIRPGAIELTGNTVVDAVRLLSAHEEPVPELAGAGAFVLVTGHRRESIGGGLARVCKAVTRLAAEFPDVCFVYPVHPNPRVAHEVAASLASRPNIVRLRPVSYTQMLWLLRRARFVITDSGGVQEEAPEFGTPVMITRTNTERPEAIEAGGAVLVGTDPQRIGALGRTWLTDDAALAAARPRANPFGDGRAAPRCVAAVRRELGLPAC